MAYRFFQLINFFVKLHVYVIDSWTKSVKNGTGLECTHYYYYLDGIFKFVMSY